MNQAQRLEMYTLINRLILIAGLDDKLTSGTGIKSAEEAIIGLHLLAKALPPKSSADSYGVIRIPSLDDIGKQTLKLALKARVEKKTVQVKPFQYMAQLQQFLNTEDVTVVGITAHDRFTKSGEGYTLIYTINS